MTISGGNWKRFKVLYRTDTGRFDGTLKYFVTHWFYKVHEGELVKAMKQKNIELKIFCGSCDEDCLSMAEQLYEITNAEGIQVELTIQEGSRHQFSK